MNWTRRGLVITALATASAGIGCGVPKDVHCRFVNDVDRASHDYAAAAAAANNPGWQAEATQLEKTVAAEKGDYCK